MNDYDYEIIESNGHLGHDNSLLDDDVLSFRPYYMEQKDPATAYVDMNTMRLMEDRKLVWCLLKSIRKESVRYKSD